MKKLSVAIILGLGMSLPYSVMADDSDVTITMMPDDGMGYDSVMKEIVLPDSASENGVINSAKGLANANERRALNRERKAERDAMKDDMGDDMDTDDIKDTMAKEDRLTGQDRADEVRATPERPELPELPEAAETHRADQSRK